MTASRPFRIAGLALVTFALAANVPYVLLIERFGYDDILREPALDVLRAFAAGGPSLVLIWLAFALCALSFVVVAGLVDDALRTTTPLPRFATYAGVASALAQAIGLSRWVFVAPGLAATASDPAATEAQRTAAVAIYEALHQFAGVAIGEHIGQTLLALWTAGLGFTLLRAGGLAARLFGLVGLVIAPLWILGQSELLATVIEGFPVLEVAPIAFMGWEVWLLALGVWWLVRGGLR